MRRIALLCTLGVVLLAMPAASAQLPPGVPAPPAAPGVPPEVTDAVNDANAQVRPYLLQGAAAAQAAVNAAGFALRPACVHGSTLALAISLGGLPVKSGVVVTPYTALCKGAMKPGPADPVLAQGDAAVGPTLQQGAEPVLEQANTVVEPQRETLALLCIALSLAGPSALPPPVSRFNPTYEVCWR